MIEIPGPIPIAIHPLFWVMVFFIGWINGGTLSLTLIWAAIIFVSVLIHEFGHALTAVCFRQKARIQLIALGGVTMFEGPKIAFWKQFLITLNGPLFGFGLFLLATLLLPFSQGLPLFGKILKMTQMANLFWTIINLLPVLPLDGGQLMRITLEGLFGVKGFKASLIIGGIIALLFACYFFIMQAFLAGAFFFLFAFLSFDMWRQSRYATKPDRDDTNKQILVQGENALQEEDTAKARQFFEEVMEKAPGGMLGNTAAQYLALINAKEGKKEEAYNLLLPIKDQLAEDTIGLLHELAFDNKNYRLVIELSAQAFQIRNDQATALRNAKAYAFEGKGRAAGGWLQAAWQFGGLDIREVLQEEEFEKLKGDREFEGFVGKLTRCATFQQD